MFKRFDDFILNIFKSFAKRTVGVFVKLGIDPVLITWINFIFFGLLPLYFIAVGDFKLHLVAVIMFLVRVYLDYIDGLLARESGRGSDLGAWFDPGSDQIITTVLAFAVFWNVYRHGMSPVMMLIGISSLFGHLQISVYSLIYEHTGIYFPSGEQDSIPTFKGDFWNKLIKDFVLIDSAFFKIVGSFKYPLLVSILFQRFDWFLIYFAVFNNVRWITMMIIYMYALAGKKSKLKLVGILEKTLDKKFS